MHCYSVDTHIRRTVYVLLACFALSFPTFIEQVRTLFNIPANWGFPVTFGAIFGVSHFLFDRVAWRWIGWLIGVPYLAGVWNATGKSNYKDQETGKEYEYAMTVRIRQTFSRMEVFTETKDSTSHSTMASICVEHAIPIFRYTFENTPKSLANEELQRHPGMIHLRVESKSKMVGDYFSGKHRVRFGELTLERASK